MGAECLYFHGQSKAWDFLSSGFGSFYGIFFYYYPFRRPNVHRESHSKPLRFAISAGIGLFISLIGFAKFIVSNPATLIGIANQRPIVLTFIRVISYFNSNYQQSKGGIIIGIVLTTSSPSHW
jgi:hypothetical protein